MKTRKWLLIFLAVVMVLGASVGSAMAYFTASRTVMGGYVINLKPDPHIVEEVTDHKAVTITNAVDAGPVFVRVKAFTGTEYEDLLTYDCDDGHWFKGAQGFYYYDLTLEAGAATSVLNVRISAVLPEDAEIGERSNVIVVYEGTPAVYKENGEPDFETAWGIGA